MWKACGKQFVLTVRGPSALGRGEPLRRSGGWRPNRALPRRRAMAMAAAFCAGPRPAGLGVGAEMASGRAPRRLPRRSHSSPPSHRPLARVNVKAAAAACALAGLRGAARRGRHRGARRPPLVRQAGKAEQPTPWEAEGFEHFDPNEFLSEDTVVAYRLPDGSGGVGLGVITEEGDVQPLCAWEEGGRGLVPDEEATVVEVSEAVASVCFEYVLLFSQQLDLQHVDAGRRTTYQLTDEVELTGLTAPPPLLATGKSASG